MGLFEAVFGGAIAHISEINTAQHTGRQAQGDAGWLKHSIFNKNLGRWEN